MSNLYSITMKTQSLIILTAVLFSFIGCDSDSEGDPKLADNIQYFSDSFLPMEIGNYWKINEDNYIEIVDTIRIKGDLFYKFYSLTGGDASGTKYLRIDNENNLIEKSPVLPSWEYIHAKFNAPVGDKFYTLSDSSVNDYEVTLSFKDDTSVKFTFKMVYHEILKGQEHIVAYKKGLGFDDRWKEVSISGTIYRY